MLINIRPKAIKTRRWNSQEFRGTDRFTGALSYAVVGTIDGERVRLSIGTENERIAIRRVDKIKTACANGGNSPVWSELGESLPASTFKFFADRAGHTSNGTKPTWSALCELFEIHMEKCIANKLRGATREEGTLAHGTCDRYRTVICHFTEFIKRDVLLSEITRATIEMYKVARHKQITGLKQSRGGSSIALDIAVLHRVFVLAIEKEMLLKNPITLAHESKPGKNPKNPARPFTADELAKLREAAGDDLFVVLLLRWTGLRGGDAIRLTWQDIHFDRGVNGEIEIVTEKREKVAIIPLSTELLNALEDERAKRKPRQDDPVLFNPEKNAPFVSRARLYERVKALGARAGVPCGRPHYFRDTLACDLLARGVGIYEVAMILADTVDTIQKCYAQFVPAARDAAQSKMDAGIGIEERARMAKTRGQKVVAMRSGV